MNRKNFETVLEQYMGRLAGLEQADDSDQVYKWRAVGCFKRFWNLDAADFAGMFEKAMREAGNLLDDAAMQPVAGLRMLLAREAEVEYVRECFRFLFSDDGSDLQKRQDRADFFADKINERVRYYERGTKKYLQTRDHVIYYLNLWKPEENYILTQFPLQPGLPVLSMTVISAARISRWPAITRCVMSFSMRFVRMRS